MSFPDFLKYIEDKSKTIQSWNEVIQIGYTPSADALIGAALLGRTLYDLQKPFIIFLIKDLGREIQKRLGNPFILVGITAESLTAIPIDLEYVAILEPQLMSGGLDNLPVINSSEFGYLRPEVSLTAIAYFLGSNFAPSLDYIIHLPLVAAQTEVLMADYTGLHDIILQDAITGKTVIVSKELTFLSAGIFDIAQSLVLNPFPFLPGLTGNERQVTKFLSNADIIVETSSGPRNLLSLDADEKKTLNSSLIVHLAQHKGYQEEDLVFIKPKTHIVSNELFPLISNTWDYAVAVQDSIKRDKHSLAIGVLLGNRSDKLRSLEKLFKEERAALSVSFQLIQDKQEQVIELKAIRYLVVGKKVNWYNAGLVAAMGLSNGLVAVDLPFAIVAPGPGEHYTIGIRASKTHKLPKSMLNLVKEIVGERGIEAQYMGSQLGSTVSFSGEFIDDFLLDLNSKLQE